MKKRFYLSTFGGFGDTLQLTPIARRLKELFPTCIIKATSAASTYSVLGSNLYFDELGVRRGWFDIPATSKRYDLIIDVRYGVKTWFPNGGFDLDESWQTIKKRQRKVELDLYVADMDFYRMKHWQLNLEKLHNTKSPFSFWKDANWYSIISYLSGIHCTPDDMTVYKQPIEGLPDSFIAVSSPTSFSRGYSKMYPTEYWNRIFKIFPNEKFVLLGTVENKSLAGDNTIHAESKLNIFQTAYVISQSKFLISEEGGLVHIAKAVKTKSVVLFGGTQKWFFGYKDNVNLRGDCKCNFCHNQIDFWNKKCMLNEKSPYCLAQENLRPDIVAVAMRKLLKEYPTATKESREEINEIKLPKSKGVEKTDKPIVSKNTLKDTELTENEQNAIVETYDDAHFDSQPCQKDRMNNLIKICMKEGIHKKVIDVGAADGYLSDKLKQLGFDVTPLDISETRVGRMKDIYGLKATLGSIRKIPFKNNSFDIVIGAEILEHLDNMSEGLAELERVCKPDGLLLITIPIGKIHDNFKLHKWSIRQKVIDREGKHDMMILQMRRIHSDYR